MKSFLVALALIAVASAQTCDYPHKGDGGVLGPNGQYILDSVLVFVDVAINTKFYADDEGDDILENQWIDASNRFNSLMQQNLPEEAFKQLLRANDSFAAVAQHIADETVRAFFIKVNREFGDLLAKRELGPINDYMIDAYPKFQQLLGCQ